MATTERASASRKPAAADRSAASTARAGVPLADRRPSTARLAQLAAVANAPNRTGLPNALKTGVERLSGHSMDQVRVHRNSAQPAQLNAHAFAQGTDIHLGPGQEKHLPHEAWHVVQQAQGRVRPTRTQFKGVAINDDAALEREADTMGARAATLREPLRDEESASSLTAQPSAMAGRAPFQLKWLDQGTSFYQWDKLQDGGIRWYCTHDTGLMYYLIERPGSVPEELLGRYLDSAGKEHARPREEWLRDPAFHWSEEEEYLPEDREIVNQSLRPSANIAALQDQFQAIAAKAFSDPAIPDYIGRHVNEHPHMYAMPSEETRAHLNRLVHLHELVKDHFAAQNIIVLARFYVHPKDAETARKYPGINSWAHLLEKKPDLSNEEITALAIEHMKRGHDIPGANVVKNSPMTSLTRSLAHTLLADSQFNRKILLSKDASRSEFAPKASSSGPKGKLPSSSLARTAFAGGSKPGSASSAKPAPPGGKFYSERIDRLMYGYGNEVMNAKLYESAPFADRIAFVAFNGDARHLYTPEMIGGDPHDCCTLEAENAVYAPVLDLNQLLIGWIPNPLPDLKVQKKVL
jgi:hypothetical protein